MPDLGCTATVRKAVAFFLMTLALGPAGAQSQAQAQANSAAQPSTGAAGPPAQVAVCGACHGVNGNSALALSPSLAGQPKVFLENTLILIREGLRPIAVMQGLLNGVSDADIVALADHYSRQKAVAPEAPRDEAAFRRGEAVASRPLCGPCHLPNYAGPQPKPPLAPQRENLAHKTN